MNHHHRELRGRMAHRKIFLRRSFPRFIFLLGFLLVACRFTIPIQVKPSSPTQLPTTTMTPSAGQVLPTPSHIFPDCSPVISPYFTINALPFRINPPQDPAQPSLANLAKEHNIRIGTAVSASLLKDESYTALLTREFNMLTPEVDMKWENIHPEPDRYDFRRGDTIVAFARLHQMSVYGHVLVWDLQLPAWVNEGQFTRQEWIQLLCTHIKSVAGHYRGQIYAWDVVNEALDETGRLRDTIWMRNIGPEYIAMAFHWAHEADPNAKLVYNDFMAEGLNQKSQAIYALVQGLLQQNVPIHAVGLQMHLWLNGPPTSSELSENMQHLSDLGLSIYITEMDIKLQYSDANQSEKLNDQARMYRQVFSACLNSPNCRGFSTWGLTDRYSWIPDYTGKTDAPLLFDNKGQPKPAYDAIIDLLRNP
jgi:endo-1,4-beta-xylanase